jgi:hypothetical protein
VIKSRVHQGCDQRSLAWEKLQGAVKVVALAGPGLQTTPQGQDVPVAFVTETRPTTLKSTWRLDAV